MIFSFGGWEIVLVENHWNIYICISTCSSFIVTYMYVCIYCVQLGVDWWRGEEQLCRWECDDATTSETDSIIDFLSLSRRPCAALFSSRKSLPSYFLFSLSLLSSTFLFLMSSLAMCPSSGRQEMMVRRWRVLPFNNNNSRFPPPPSSSSPVALFTLLYTVSTCQPVASLDLTSTRLSSKIKNLIFGTDCWMCEREILLFESSVGHCWHVISTRTASADDEQTATATGRMWISTL